MLFAGIMQIINRNEMGNNISVECLEESKALMGMTPAPGILRPQVTEPRLSWVTLQYSTGDVGKEIGN